MNGSQLRTKDPQRAPARRRRAPFHTLMALLIGPFVLVALLLALIAVAFNLWPTLNRMSEWGD